jgi:2-polyprenyl-3-methyl-5-hydroxy-6-metoxy-1,4-benzoquinol methylase
MKCPLCNSQAKLKQSINVASLINLWQRVGIDVSKIFSLKFIHKYKCDNCGLGFYSPPSPGDDHFYSSLATWDWYYKHPGKSEYKYTAEILSPGMKLIDVGCGIGEFSSYLPKGVEFYGAELSTKSIEIAKSLGRNVSNIDITLPEERFINNFDVVSCFQVLEHIVDVNSFFKALIDLCKPGGLIVLAVPNNDGFVGDAFNNVLNMPPHHCLLWNRRSLHFLARKFSVDVIDYVDEELSDVHRYWGFSVRINKFLRKFIFLKELNPIDLSIKSRFIWIVSSLLARPLSLIWPNLVKSGHSSIILFRKKT